MGVKRKNKQLGCEENLAFYAEHVKFIINIIAVQNTCLPLSPGSKSLDNTDITDYYPQHLVGQKSTFIIINILPSIFMPKLSLSYNLECKFINIHPK